MSTRTVLVLEDNDIIREGTAVVLRREGYKVVGFADGKEALDYCRSNKPDVILLDMIIPPPGWDGWQFLDKRRADPALASVPVILTTGLDVACKEWATYLGASALLRKPVDGEPLLAEVRRCLREHNPSRNPDK